MTAMLRWSPGLGLLSGALLILISGCSGEDPNGPAAEARAALEASRNATPRPMEGPGESAAPGAGGMADDSTSGVGGAARALSFDEADETIEATPEASGEESGDATGDAVDDAVEPIDPDPASDAPIIDEPEEPAVDPDSAP